MAVPLARVLELVGPHCDLQARLEAVPPSAASRGVIFRSIERALEREGKLAAYHEVFGSERIAPLRFYAMTDYLVRAAMAGAILRSPERVHEGLFEIGRYNATSITESLIGRSVIRLLSRDPRRLLQQAVAGRRLTTAYGQWTLEFPGERSAVMRFVEEYSWIESVLLGAAQGTFDMIDLPVRIEVQLDGPFEGSHRIHW
jgi:uncharacterized protein (TIGR02265 family)